MGRVKVDEALKQELLDALERVPDGAVETRSFALDQAELAERCEPALTRGEQWRENRRDDQQTGLFDDDV